MVAHGLFKTPSILKLNLVYIPPCAVLKLYSTALQKRRRLLEVNHWSDLCCEEVITSICMFCRRNPDRSHVREQTTAGLCVGRKCVLRRYGGGIIESLDLHTHCMNFGKGDCRIR